MQPAANGCTLPLKHALLAIGPSRTITTKHPKEGNVDRFELPPDIAILDNEQLEQLLNDAVGTYDAITSGESITAEELNEARQIAESIRTIRAEKQTRIDAAAEALREIESMNAEVHGEAPVAEGDEGGDGDEGGEPEPEPQEPGEGGDEGGDGDEGGEPADGEGAVAEGELVTAAANTSRRPLNLAAVRARQPKQKLPATAKREVTIRASADVPGIAIGAKLDIDNLVDGVISRACGLRSAGRAAQALVASYALPFDDDFVVKDATSAAAGTSALMAAGDQTRLPGGDLVASGGWCAPSETIYDITDVACPDMLWSPPQVQLRRGGVRFFTTPTLDVSQLSWIHTEANDIAGDEKPCFHVPCPDPIEVRCDAIGVCISAGILTEKHFPELVSWYVRNSMVAHEIRISQAMYLAAIAASTHVVVEESMAAFTAVFGRVALEAADLVEKHSLCDTIGIEVVFPWWARNAFLTDIARQNGRALDEVDPAVINRAFATLGVSVQWARGLPPQAGTEIGGTNPAAAWPDMVPFLIHPAGAFQIGRGAQVDLGVVHDSNMFKTNDYTAVFTEECVALLPRGPESRYVEVPICPDGTTGKLATDVSCPIDAGDVVS